MTSREVENMMMPYALEQDSEKQLKSASSDTSVSNSNHSIVVRGTRLRLRILGIIAITVIPVLAVLFVLLMSVIILYTVVPIPEIVLMGNISGVVNASLGTLGHAVLTPIVEVRLKIAL